MTYISAEELELLSFFEVEPDRLDADVPWPYNDFAYQVSRGEYSLSFAVQPAYRDVRIILKRGDTVLYELNAVGIDDLKYHNDKNHEVLEIVLNERDRLWLVLQPDITIRHQATERT